MSLKAVEKCLVYSNDQRSRNKFLFTQIINMHFDGKTKFVEKIKFLKAAETICQPLN